MPTWSILIPTLSSRHGYLKRLLAVLLPQAEDAEPGSVEVVALHNDGNWPLIEIRQALLDDARGEWLSFVDDDDMVEPDYIPSILACLKLDPDFVAFQQAIYWDGKRDARTVYTGLQFREVGWAAYLDRFVCDVTHINPVRTTLARQAGYKQFVDGWEDRGFNDALRPLLRTQEEIPRVMYHYLHRSTNTVQNFLGPHGYLPRPYIASPAFRWHSWSTG